MARTEFDRLASEIHRRAGHGTSVEARNPTAYLNAQLENLYDLVSNHDSVQYPLMGIYHHKDKIGQNLINWQVSYQAGTLSIQISPEYKSPAEYRVSKILHIIKVKRPGNQPFDEQTVAKVVINAHEAISRSV